MPNIPGIVGYIQPGAYTNVKSRQGAVALPGGPTVTCIMGEGRREEVLVVRAAGGGADGLPAQFDPRLKSDGRYFRLANYPVVPGTLEVYLNPKFDGTDLPLVRVSNTSEGSAWLTEFGKGALLKDGYGVAQNEAWSSSITYNIGEFVQYNGSLFKALIKNVGATPTDGTTWKLVVTPGTENDGYGGLPEGTPGGGGVNFDKGIMVDAGVLNERDYGLDGFQGLDSGTGFFDTSYGRRYGKWKQRLRAGSTEPQHYYFDDKTGQLILDYPLNRRDTLTVRYLAEGDVNSYEEFTDLQKLYDKHGYPAVQNTIALAALMAAENGAPIIGAIHAGLTYNAGQLRWVADPFWTDAFQQLEKYNPYFIVPVAKTFVEDEVIMPAYDSVLYGALTGNGTYLQEVQGGGDEPGINIWPLAVDKNGAPLLLKVFKNERELMYGVDYTASYLQGPQPVRLNLATPLIDGDRVTATYRPEIDLVATVQQVTKVHIELMSDTPHRRERMAMTGGYEGYTITEALDETKGVDNNFGDSFRMMFFMPERIRRVVNGETAYLDGQYIAAAASGRMTGEEYIAEPLTRKTLIGFDIEQSKRYSDIEERLLGEVGVSVVAGLNSGGRVVNGFTTVNTGNAVEEEPSVVRIRDYTAYVTRQILENRFVGKVILGSLVDDVAISTESILKSLISQQLITAYANVRVEVDPQEPRQVNVSFDIQPVFPLNWIRIDFSVGIL